MAAAWLYGAGGGWMAGGEKCQNWRRALFAIQTECFSDLRRLVGLGVAKECFGRANVGKRLASVGLAQAKGGFVGAVGVSFAVMAWSFRPFCPEHSRRRDGGEAEGRG